MFFYYPVSVLVPCTCEADSSAIQLCSSVISMRLEYVTQRILFLDGCEIQSPSVTKRRPMLKLRVVSQF